MNVLEPLQLLGGLSPELFMKRHWQKKPLLARQAIPGFKPLLDRSALFELAAREDEAALGELDSEHGFNADTWGRALDGYYGEHDEILTGAPARSPQLLLIDETGPAWTVRQILDDPDGNHDWGISAVIDLAASDEAGEAVVRVTAVDRL